jgi:6-phosphogluconolactonase
MVTGRHRLLLLSLMALFLTACGGGESAGVAPSVSNAAVPPCGIEGSGVQLKDCNGQGLDQPSRSSSLVPSCAPVGGGPFTLTVYGSQNFSAGSVVQWNGSDRPTTVDGTRLSAEISASDIAAGGTATITVNPAASNFSTATFTISAGGMSPQSVAVDPTGKFVYVANAGCAESFVGSVSMYAINPGTGLLSSLGPPVNTDFGSHSVAVDPTGKFVYVANDADFDSPFGSVSTLAIDAANGTLRLTETIAARCDAAPPSPGNCAPFSVAVHPSGRFVYVANEGGFLPTSISMYAANVTTGDLTDMGTIAAAGRAVSVGLHPSGKFAYLVNGIDAPGGVSMYTIDITTGALTPGVTIAAGTNPASIAVDPTGKFAYVTNADSNDVSMYTISATTGALTSGGTVAAGTNPLSVAVDPTGKFAYVTNAGSNDVSMYTINATTGTLTAIGRVVAGALPASMAVDPAGKFAYVVNSDSNNVYMYSIDAATGALMLLGTIGT